MSINQSNLRNFATRPTGEIKMSDFYGKSNKTKPVTPTISYSQLKNTYVKFSSNVAFSELEFKRSSLSPLENCPSDGVISCVSCSSYTFYFRKKETELYLVINEVVKSFNVPTSNTHTVTYTGDTAYAKTAPGGSPYSSSTKTVNFSYNKKNVSKIVVYYELDAGQINCCYISHNTAPSSSFALRTNTNSTIEYTTSVSWQYPNAVSVTSSRTYDFSLPVSNSDAMNIYIYVFGVCWVTSAGSSVSYFTKSKITKIDFIYDDSVYYY